MSRHHTLPCVNPSMMMRMKDGVRFGKALQMTNILRDIPEDLRFGRCYIPRPRLDAVGLTPEDLRNPGSMESFQPVFQRVARP